MIPRRSRWDISDHLDNDDNADPMDPTDPMDSSDATEPALPIDRMDPALPIDRIEPFEAIESREPSDHNDQRDLQRDPSDTQDIMTASCLANQGPRSIPRCPGPNSPSWHPAAFSVGSGRGPRGR